MKLVKELARSLLNQVPENPLLYRACCAYVEKHDGDNNDDMNTNGESHLLRRVLPVCYVAFDVGANLGEWTKLALSVNPNLQVHCFEPSALTFSTLAENDFPGNVILNNIGLSSTQKESVLYIAGKTAGTNSLYDRQDIEMKEIETVRLDTLDNYFHTHNLNKIDFLKIDVEGHELEVLRGASEILNKGIISFIQFEYGACYIDAGIFLRDVFKFLDDLDYNVYKIYQGGLRFIRRYHHRLETFKYSNWLLVHKSHVVQ